MCKSSNCVPIVQRFPSSGRTGAFAGMATGFAQAVLFHFNPMNFEPAKLVGRIGSFAAGAMVLWLSGVPATKQQKAE